MLITKDEYIIRPLIREDAKLLKSWGSFNDPLYHGYEYNNLTKKEEDIWYRLKRKIHRSEYFSVISHDNHLIGYIGIKQINLMLKSALLGIVLDPNYTSKSYGTKIMSDFLDYYFIDKEMRVLNLEVNSWNKRGIRLYEKFGFEIKNSKFIVFENQSLDLSKEEYKDIRDDFKYINSTLQTKIYKMKLERQVYLNEIRNRK